MIETLLRARRDLIERSSTVAWLPRLAARVAIGIVFIQSGWGKLHNLEQVTAFFESLGIPLASVQAPFVASVELAGGVLVLAGLATRLASLPLIGVMSVAIVTAIWPNLESASEIFFKGELLFIVLLGWLVVDGPGAVSMDALVLRRAARRSGIDPGRQATARAVG